MYSIMRMRIPLTVVAAVLLTSLCRLPSAFADEPFFTETVKFGDLNLDSTEGVQTLYNRIHAAARRVCPGFDSVLHVAAGACIVKAEAGAIAKVNRPQLTALYQAKTGTSVHAKELVASR